jgi:phosphoenolpyruvate carboxykinase (ATP)
MLNTITTPALASGLESTGVRSGHSVACNLHAPALVSLALSRGEGVLSEDGALVVSTGVHTGRSVQDKFVADEPETSDGVWWGKVNNRLSPAHFDGLANHVRAYLEQQALFTQDLYAGADPAHRICVRLVTTTTWHALFARNMFIRPTAAELAAFEPDFVILHAPDLAIDPAEHGVRTSTVVALSFAQRLIVIAGTEYAGEIKKAIFTVMNWLMPARSVLPMHCSANVGADGDVALFFGLSGTGKTTLSSDPQRQLIGDDEHGWSDHGVFNFEGGCYAKVIDLQQAAEPQIWAATHRFGAVLENVVCDGEGRLDLADKTLTANTRSCYPIEYIAGARRDGLGGMPRNVVMLTADAFGVLPPISRLTPAQAMYHFLSGYTARVAGTEKGLPDRPQATFSACFGAPFLPRAPQVYGALLKQFLSRHGVSCWLVNTGWTGGAYGTGHRMSIAYTRSLLAAALNGRLEHAEFTTEPFFGLSIPRHVEGVPSEILDPALAWVSEDAYASQASDLARLFVANFASFADDVDAEVRAACIHARA